MSIGIDIKLNVIHCAYFGEVMKHAMVVYYTLNTVLRISRSSVALRGNFHLFKLPTFHWGIS